jgi:hypothetical protein
MRLQVFVEALAPEVSTLRLDCDEPSLLCRLY